MDEVAKEMLAALIDCREALRRVGFDGELKVVDAAISKGEAHARDAKDAARWRFLRDHRGWDQLEAVYHNHGPEELDEYADKGIAQVRALS